MSLVLGMYLAQLIGGRREKTMNKERNRLLTLLDLSAFAYSQDPAMKTRQDLVEACLWRNAAPSPRRSFTVTSCGASTKRSSGRRRRISRTDSAGSATASHPESSPGALRLLQRKFTDRRPAFPADADCDKNRPVNVKDAPAVVEKPNAEGSRPAPKRIRTPTAVARDGTACSSSCAPPSGSPSSSGSSPPRPRSPRSAASSAPRTSAGSSSRSPSRWSAFS